MNFDYRYRKRDAANACQSWRSLHVGDWIVANLPELGNTPHQIKYIFLSADTARIGLWNRVQALEVEGHAIGSLETIPLSAVPRFLMQRLPTLAPSALRQMTRRQIEAWLTRENDDAQVEIHTVVSQVTGTPPLVAHTTILLSEMTPLLWKWSKGSITMLRPRYGYTRMFERGTLEEDGTFMGYNKDILQLFHPEGAGQSLLTVFEQADGIALRARGIEDLEI